MRIAIHTQHFLGVGHHIRMMSLARVLARQHTVEVYDGGRPFQSAAQVDNPRHVQLPTIVKLDNHLVPLGTEASLEAVFLERAEKFRAGIERLEPDVVITEFFPLSRWAFRREIFAGINAARSINPKAKIYSSLRDVPRIPFEKQVHPDLDWDPVLGRPIPLSPHEAFLDNVPSLLSDLYDAVLVHGDPTVSRIEDHFPWLDKLSVPVHYTGYIRDDRGREAVEHHPGHGPLIVVSVGADSSGGALLRCAMQAWRLLKPDAGAMMLFAGAFMSPEEVRVLQDEALECGATLRPYASDFLDWLEVADLSISRVGYNTTVGVLAAGVRSLLIPARLVPDQRFRAKRLQELCLATCISEQDIEPKLLADSIVSILSGPRPEHSLELNGARRTQTLLEAAG